MPKEIHPPLDLNDDSFYAGKSKKDWIKWAEGEIEEYQRFLKFLKKK